MITSYHRKLAARTRDYHKKHWTSHNVRSLLVGIIMLVVALYIQHLANSYVTAIQGMAVQDLLLGHLPLFNISGFIIQFSLLLGVVIVLCFVYRPHYLNFGIRALALFIAIRSFFIILTHLGANPEQLTFSPHITGFEIYNLLFNTSNDYFFSGHTGMPFLMALILWKERMWRYIFLVASVIMGISMLIARMHYSIDVLAAPFITYSIFCIAQYLFPREYKVSRE